MAIALTLASLSWRSARAGSHAFAGDESPRLEEVGTGAEDDEREPGGEEPDERDVEASADVSQLGRVTYASARVDLPIGRYFSVIPEAALLRVGSYGPDDPTTWEPYVGAAIGFQPSDATAFELGALFGPSVQDTRSVEVELDASDAIGIHEDDSPPTLDLEGALALRHVHWSDGLGPAGSDLLQAYAQLQAIVHPSARFELAPNVMYFVYDRPLDRAVGERIGSISVLAHVGSYAPRALLGSRVGYALTKVIAPWLEVDEILYAAGVGHGTEVLAGARIDVEHAFSASIGAGLLLNRVASPLVPEDDDERTVPVAVVELSHAFE